jgi:prophage regulatory protein
MKDVTYAILRLNGVLKKTGYSRTRLYLDMGRGLFPKQISLGSRAVGWLESEVDAWIAEQIARSRSAK